MYEVSNTNSAYYHCLASNIFVDLSCFLSTFLSTEHSLASLPPLLPLRHLCYWASHSPVHHHAEDLLLSHNHRHEGSDSPFHIFHSRSPKWYVPSGQHLLLAARIPTTTCITLLYQPLVPPPVSPYACLPGRYTPSLISRMLEHLMLLHLDRWSLPVDQSASAIILVIISYIPSPPQLCQCVSPQVLVV